MNYTTISVSDFARKLQNQEIPLCIDVRSEAEFYQKRCRGSQNIPVDVIESSAVHKLIDHASLKPDETIYLICKAGKRSMMAAEKLVGTVANPICIVADGGVEDVHQDLHVSG